MKLTIVAATLLASSAPALAGTVSGPARIVDGDTIEIGSQRIRLFGIDAPESAQTCDRNGERWPCGAEATRQLEGMIGGAPLVCTGEETDEFGRLVAVCTVAGVDLNRELVAQGWATAFRRYSDRYASDEVRARAARLGLWSSSFQPPEDFRAASRADDRRSGEEFHEDRTVRQAGGCVIKGNRSRPGPWIYHLPGMPYYDETRAEEMFCTEAEAQAAGYRRAKVQ